MDIQVTIGAQGATYDDAKQSLETAIDAFLGDRTDLTVTRPEKLELMQNGENWFSGSVTLLISETAPVPPTE